MTHYELYVVDERGNSSSWSHTNEHRGKPCMVFADDVNQTIVLHHPSMTTYIYISASGELDIHVEETPQPAVETQVADDTSRRARRRKRPRRRRSS
jgi:hypothetical protein